MFKKFSILMVIVILAGILSACAGQSNPGQMTPQINVSGKGEVYLVPDIAYVYIGTRSESADVATSLSENIKQAQDIASTLQNLGVDPIDIQTTSFNVYPVQNYGPDGQVTDTKYVVENTVFVKVRELTRLGELLDAVVRSGANNINGINFDVENREQAEAEARKMAVQDATQKAQELAEAAGVSLGEILSLNVYSSGSPQPVYDAKGGGYAASGAQVPVASGQLLITAEASVTYGLK